jgi:hypothetical protein
VIRAQLVKETYHFKTIMTTANENPPITGVDTAATGWVTVKINRDAAANITGGSVTFDVNFTNTGPITFTGLHIHYPGVAGVNAGVVINTGVAGGANSVESTTGSGNITRVVNIDAPNAITLQTLNALITAPETAYINLHTTQFGGGVVRSQMFPVFNTVAQAAGGGDWQTEITVRNPSTTTAVQGIVNFFSPIGTLMPAAVTDPNISFLIPPGGSTTVSTHNKGSFSGGFAKVFSNGNVTVESRYGYPAYTANNLRGTTVTSRSVSLPVRVANGGLTNTGIALITNSAGTLSATLTNAFGLPIPGGSASVAVPAGIQIAAFVSEVLTTITSTEYAGTLTITITSGTISVMALQFDTTITPVTITPLP